MPNLAANGQDPSGCAARNLENDPWSAWYGTQNEQTNGCGAPNGCGNAGGEQSRFHTVHGPGGMTPQVAAYQQILNLLPAIGGPQLLSLRQVLHDAHGQVRNFAGEFWWQCQSTLHGCTSIWSRSRWFHSNAELYSRTTTAAAEWQL